jgi:hypothetical protein
MPCGFSFSVGQIRQGTKSQHPSHTVVKSKECGDRDRTMHMLREKTFGIERESSLM